MNDKIKLTPRNGKVLFVYHNQITGVQGFETGTDVWVTGGHFFNVKETAEEVIKLIAEAKKTILT